VRKEATRSSVVLERWTPQRCINPPSDCSPTASSELLGPPRASHGLSKLLQHQKRTQHVVEATPNALVVHSSLSSCTLALAGASTTTVEASLMNSCMIGGAWRGSCTAREVIEGGALSMCCVACLYQL